MKGWAIAGRGRSRVWHFFEPDSALFPRFRSICGIEVLHGDPPLWKSPGQTRTGFCDRCATELVFDVIHAARANPAGAPGPPLEPMARAADEPGAHDDGDR